MRDLAALTAQLSGSEWQQALVQLIHQLQLEQDQAGQRLHDETGQNLSALGLQLGVLAMDLKDSAPAFAERVHEIQRLLETSMSQVRQISAALNPSFVDRAGLRMALDSLIDERAPQFSGGCTLECPVRPTVERPAARALFRIASPAIDFGATVGATTIRLRVLKELFGWSLEVLYDVSSPKEIYKLKANVRLTLLLLHYQGIRAGVNIVLDDAPSGGSLIRATYSVGDQPR